MPSTAEMAANRAAETEVEYESFEAVLAAKRERMAEARVQATETKEPVSGADAFKQVYSTLNASVKTNSQADYESWLQSDENKVYAHILKRLAAKESDQTLKPYELDVLRYMNLHAKLNTAQSMTDLDGVDEAEAIKGLVAFAKEKMDEAPESDKAAIASAVASMGGTYSRIRPVAGAKKPTGKELAEYVRLVESGVSGEELQAARDKMLFAVRCMNQDRETYGFLAAKYPSKTAMQAVESVDVRQARESQEAARSELAWLYARRQKRVYGADWMSNTHFNKHARHFGKARREYQYSLEEQLVQELNNREFSAVKDLNRYLATRAVRLAREFSRDIDLNYRTNNSLIGKTINYLGDYDENGEKKQRSLRRTLGKIALHTAVIAPAGIATVVTGGAFLAVAAGGAWTSANIYSRWEAKKRAERMQRSSDTWIDEERVASQLELFDEYAEQTPLDLIRTKIGNVARTLVDAAEYDTVTQQKRRLGRVAASAAAGAAVAVGGHYLGAWLGGGDHAAHAVSQDHSPQLQVPSVAPSPSVVPEIHNGLSNVYAHYNMGWYEVMQQMGIDPAQRHDILVKAAPNLLKNHFAYGMSDGLPGVPSTGYIPQAAIDILSHAAGR